MSCVAAVISRQYFRVKPSRSFIFRGLSDAVAKKTYFVINALGIDRPGIVSDVTKVVTDAGGNVGESRAIRLGGHFSMIVLVSVPVAGRDTLMTSLGAVKDMTMTALQTSDPQAVKISPKAAYIGNLKLSGADNPGIVHKVTSLISSHGISIDELRTSQEDAPFGGTTLFLMNGVVSAAHPVAQSFDITALRDELKELGNSLNCDITLE
eukprot:52529_1